jgi:hypothetical protein
MACDTNIRDDRIPIFLEPGKELSPIQTHRFDSRILNRFVFHCHQFLRRRGLLRAITTEVITKVISATAMAAAALIQNHPSWSSVILIATVGVGVSKDITFHSVNLIISTGILHDEIATLLHPHAFSPRSHKIGFGGSTFLIVAKKINFMFINFSSPNLTFGTVKNIYNIYYLSSCEQNPPTSRFR